MRYLCNEGSITLRGNALTWSIDRFHAIPLEDVWEISTEFLFRGCRCTLAIWPSSHKGCEDFFGVCLYSKGESRLIDFIEFSMEDKYGHRHSCRIERSENGLYRNEKFMLLSEFIDSMPLGRLTMVCKMFSHANTEFTSSAADESTRDINDSGEFVYVSSLKKFPVEYPGDCSCPVEYPNGDRNWPVEYPNGDYNCPSYSATISSRFVSDCLLGFPPDVSAFSSPPDLPKQGKFGKLAKIESDFGTDAAGENMESKANCKRNKKKTPYQNKMYKKEMKHSRSQSDSKILMKDKKISDGYLLKTNGKHIPCRKSQIESNCGKQKNVEVLQPGDDIEICKEVIDDNLVEAFGLESSCKLDPISPLYMEKNIEVLQQEDENTSENLACNQSLKIPCIAKTCLEDVAEPANHHISGRPASYEDPEVVCDNSSNINIREKKEICSACFNSNPQKQAECEKNNAEDKSLSVVPQVNENPHASEFQPSVKLQNNLESDIEELDATNRNIVIKPDESSNVDFCSSTDTEKVAAKECKFRAAPVDVTNYDLENRSSLGALKNLELKMAKIVSEMKKFEKLSEDYKNLYLEGKDSDMTIKMGDRAFKVRKSILMRRSAGFAKLLSGNTGEISNNTICIDINGCDSGVFHNFLLYLYSAKCESMSNANVFGLYCSANEFDVPELKEECIQFMKNSLGLQSICDVISLAKKYNEAELMEVATRFFAKYVKNIRETDKWKLFRREDPDTAEELFMRSLEILEKNNKQSSHRTSTDTEKVAAEECKFRAAPVDVTNYDLENRSSLGALKNLEFKMAKIVNEMKKFEKLSEDYKNLYLEGKDSDMTIKMGDRVFKVRKSILMRRSAGFAKLLSNNSGEISNNTICIDINGCDSGVFHIFLLYIYSAKCESMSIGNVFGLYHSANEFDVPELKEECIQFMKNSLDLQSICDVINLAKKYNEAELMEVATRFFAKYVKNIRETDKWKLFRREDPDTAEELFMRSLEILEKNIK